jgi:hypothetical protein
MLVAGPLTGDIPPTDRQAMVDELANARGPAVLVSQIQADGVGLNIQVASVIIIAEPLNASLTGAVGGSHRWVDSLSPQPCMPSRNTPTPSARARTDKRGLLVAETLGLKR